MVFWANLILAGFNLLPAFPLDGGRILRGLLTMRMGWARATVWAASIGQIAAVVLILVGFVHDFWLVLAGLLVLPAANAELRYALAVRQFANRCVGEVARSEPGDARCGDHHFRCRRTLGGDAGGGFPGLGQGPTGGLSVGAPAVVQGALG